MSPIGHSLTGMTFYCLASRQGILKKNIGALLLVGIISNLPDLDFIPGLLLGTLNIFHNLFTHSLFFALFVTLLFIPFKNLQKTCELNPWTVFMLISLHLVIDSFCGPQLGFHETYGVAFFYPLHKNWISMPFTIFPGIKHKDLSSILTLYNLRTVSVELAVGTVSLVLAHRHSKRMRLKDTLS